MNHSWKHHDEEQILSGFTQPILTRPPGRERTTSQMGPAPSQQLEVMVGTQGSPKGSWILIRRQRSWRVLPTSNAVPPLNYILGYLWLINNITSDQILECPRGLACGPCFSWCKYSREPGSCRTWFRKEIPFPFHSRPANTHGDSYFP